MNSVIHSTPQLPDPWRPEIPEPALAEAGRVYAQFKFLDEKHPLDAIPYPQRTYSGNDSERAMQELRFLAGKALNMNDIKSRDSLLGVWMSQVPRRNYQMVATPLGKMKEFFDSKVFTSTEVFAKNSPVCKGGITASFNRYADTTTLLRKIEGADGSSDLYTGRPDTLKKAREQSTFMFLSEMQLWKAPDKRDLAKGISYNEATGQYEFRFAVQSLLTLHSGERKMARDELEMFETFNNTVAEIQDPNDLGKTYSVVMKPFPLIANNFNYMNLLEEILPDAVTGKSWGDQLTQKGDLALFEFAKNQLDNPLINDTIEQMKSGKLKQWELTLCRALLCHLLKIPQIVHCKSSVDRTNLAAAMITAMKQWILAGKEIPKVNGRFAVHHLPNVQIEGGDFPFKELFACNLTKGLKIGEFARFNQGFKFNRNWCQHPTLFDLLPERYFEKVEQSTAKIWAMRIGLTLLVITGLYHALWLLSLIVPKRIYSKMYPGNAVSAFFAFAAVPFHLIWHADKFSPKIRVKEAGLDPLLGHHRLLHKKGH